MTSTATECGTVDIFQPNGVDDDGLANILLSPRRKEPVLVDGTMFLRPSMATSCGSKAGLPRARRSG